MRNTISIIVDMIERAPTSSSPGNGPQVGMINNAFATRRPTTTKTDMPFPAPCPRAIQAQAGVRFLVGEGTLGPPFLFRWASTTAGRPSDRPSAKPLRVAPVRQAVRFKR